MPDREKVIKAIKCMKTANKRCGNPCERTGACEYAAWIRGLDGEPYYPCYCDVKRLCEDALALQKAHEPRVMTLEEVKQAEVGTVVWLEWRIESKINSAIFFRLINKGIDDSLEFLALDGVVAARLACYGAKWRCWTYQPTRKQREAVKWDEAD